jgi:glucose uptake protein GlcU
MKPLWGGFAPFALILVNLFVFDYIMSTSSVSFLWTVGNWITNSSLVTLLVSLAYLLRALYIKVFTKKVQSNKKWRQNLQRGIAGVIVASVIYIIIQLLVGLFGISTQPTISAELDLPTF